VSIAGPYFGISLVEGSSGNRTGRFRQYSWYGARRFVDWAG